ncbi:MAG: hypothetical protein IT270_04385 [Saprospiraceae bacterium]|nr:hypothetical protein [Saprospiraceae bacterium]
MKAILKSALFLLFVAALLPACRSSQKMIESGNYDAAIDFCIQKLRGKKNKKNDYVKGLEMAFQKANARDVANIDRLKLQNREENWTQIHDMYTGIERRQKKIRPLLPLRSKSGYTARFTFIDVSREENESREQAAAFLYAKAEALLERGKRGEKLAARDAYYTLRDIEKKYYNTYREKDRLMREARNWGTSFVLFEVKNQSGKILPTHLNDRLGAVADPSLNEEWKEFIFEAENNVDYDYFATLRFRDIDVSPERVHERSYVDEKRIQDGWEYEYDSKGNVKKDSLGNDIKNPKFVIIRAEVLEVFQSKAARVGATLDIVDGATRKRLDSSDMSTEVLFENYASTFRGDKRALSEESKQRIGNRPLPFPTDADMILQAADRLKPQLRDALRRSNAIF